MNSLTGPTQFYQKLFECAITSLNSGKCEENEKAYNFFIRYIILRTKKCDKYKKFFESELKEFIAPALDRYNLKIGHGLSYTQLGAVLGDQGVALKLMAIGDYFGWWTVKTPSDIIEFEMSIEEYKQLAESGVILLIPKEDPANIMG